MIGVEAFIPYRTSSTASQDEINIERIKVYVAGNRRIENGQQNKVQNNTFTNPKEVNKLFQFNDYTHTERQLVTCAILCNAHIESITVNVDPNEINKSIRNAIRTQNREHLRGELHIFTPAPPCGYANNIENSGGMYCTQYYANLTDLFSSYNNSFVL